MGDASAYLRRTLILLTIFDVVVVTFLVEVKVRKGMSAAADGGGGRMCLL